MTLINIQKKGLVRKQNEFTFPLECSYSQAILFQAGIDFTAILNNFLQVFQAFQENYRTEMSIRSKYVLEQGFLAFKLSNFFYMHRRV